MHRSIPLHVCYLSRAMEKRRSAFPKSCPVCATRLAVILGSVPEDDQEARMAAALGFAGRAANRDRSGRLAAGVVIRPDGKFPGSLESTTARACRPYT